MKTFLSYASLAVATLIAPAAFPCGAPFGTGINVDPKQDIVLAHKNGVETYAFQPRFCGTASEFGLILPVPSKLSAAPTMSLASVFKLVDSLSQPEYRTETVCGYPTRSAGSNGNSGDAGNKGGTVVVSSGTVGFMDYSQLKADSTASFTDWLDKNGYPYDALASSAFAYYVEKGWYFLAFKISQGTVPSGSTVCKDLGPVKFSFPSEQPVVPTRMATARNRDASGSLAYASSFSWRIFGITKGTQQIGFADGASARRTLGYSGLIKDSDIASLDGLAEKGDRLDKLTVSFDYGSTAPDIGLTLATGSNYREIITNTVYVSCPEAGAPDVSAIKLDASLVSVDALQPVTPDAMQVIPARDAGAAPDTAVVVLADAGVPVSADAAKAPPPEEVSEHKSSGGCALAAGPAGSRLGALLVFALALLIRRRRR